MNWINVETKLPEGFWAPDSLQEYYKKFSQLVNIYTDNGVVSTGAFNRETKKWFVGDLTPQHYQEVVTKVLCWMPLPEPPNKEQFCTNCDCGYPLKHSRCDCSCHD
jgi:hypothetical protein